MTTFQFDTSGAVDTAPPGPPRPGCIQTLWSDLSPFAQGYVEAMFAANSGRTPFGRLAMFPVEGEPDTHQEASFSDLAPETLARIIEDCEQFQKPPSDWVVFNHATGGDFWRDRQARQLTRLASERFPPLIFYLGDDGRVQFQEAGR